MRKIDIEELKHKGKFAVILKCILTRNHVKQSELANAIGLSNGTITNYMNGKSTPSQENLYKIAKYLDINPNEFYRSIDEHIQYFDNFDDTFVTKFNELLNESGETQEELAKVIGVSRQTINYYANGKMMPMEDVLIKIANHFNKPKSYFFKNNIEKIPDKEMAIVVTKMPTTPRQCLFSISNFFNDYNECKLGNLCTLRDGKCPYLVVCDEAKEDCQ